MATQVLFASPRPLSPSAEQRLSPAQSLAVVDIFINASIACICHTRELIPWDSACFRVRYIDDLKSGFWKNDVDKYSAFCNTEPTVPSVKSQEFRILKRGVDKRADGILDLIETGVFSAVKGGILEAIRFFVTQGGTKCDTADILESYTLNFSYDHGNEGGSSVRSVFLNSNHAFTTDSAIKSFKRAIKSLLTSLQGLPAMPRKRSIGVAMLYNNQCPTTYEAPERFLTEDVSLTAKEQSGWHNLLLQTAGEVGQFDVGPYRVVVGASHIRPSLEVPTSSTIRDLGTHRQLQNLLKSSSQLQTSTLDDPGSRNPHNTPVINRATSEACSPILGSQPTFHVSAKEGSQHSRGRGTAPHTASIMTRKTRKRNVAPVKLAELIVRASNLEANRGHEHIFDPERLQRNEIVRLNASLGSRMRCDCGDESSSGDHLLCTLCGTSQHVECYGWKGIPQVKFPDEHFCYSCLLLPREAELKAQMTGIVRKRLALAYMEENNSTTIDDLMHAMHLSRTEEDHEIFNETVDCLQQEGYLTQDRPAIMVTMNKVSATNALRDFINPLAKISHHFVTLRDNDKKDVRTNAIAAAVEEYAQNRTYFPASSHVDYEQKTAEDNFGRNSQRGGFYLDSGEFRKRKAASPPIEESSFPKRITLARKASYHEDIPPEDETPPPYQPRRMSAMRKASRSQALVSLDRSSPATVFSTEDDVFTESVYEATAAVQWEAFAGGGRNHGTSSTGSIPYSTP